MGRLFLSYAREDAATASLVARNLERAGHTIWWDRHLGGGARFAKEIAAALKDAEAVLVLWSQHSIDSSWVQDEAGEGRDSGRLVMSEKLSDQTGRRLTVRGGEVTDGPFIESKDAVGGIFVIEAASLDEATQVARSCPGLTLQHGYVEVRVVEEKRSVVS